MPSENISDGILSVMLPNTVNNILSRLFQTAFEKQGVSVKYSGLNLNQDKAAKPQTKSGQGGEPQTIVRTRRGNAVLV
ncbi:hypothetical protein [Neisseria meningitidis]|uniref:hypothetical protein n=1 Tax=Neisseria meningitidis TaxID=487 RepID=UPI00061CB52D|nr:hypothetical protein [Neisseria meningitidis]CKK07550.1 Uncharacterised protein [Neisseria meningitidis]